MKIIKLSFYIFFLCFYSVSCSTIPDNKDLEEYVNTTIATVPHLYESTLRIASYNKKLNEKYANWSLVVADDDIIKEKQLDSLVTVGFLEKSIIPENNDHRYHLTELGWANLGFPGSGSDIKFHLGHYQLGKILKVSSPKYISIKNEKIYFVETELKIKNLPDWANDKHVQESYPEIKRLTGNIHKNYIFVDGPKNKQDFKDIYANIRTQMNSGLVLGTQVSDIRPFGVSFSDDKMSIFKIIFIKARMQPLPARH